MFSFSTPLAMVGRLGAENNCVRHTHRHYVDLYMSILYYTINLDGWPADIIKLSCTVYIFTHTLYIYFVQNNLLISEICSIFLLLLSIYIEQSILKNHTHITCWSMHSIVHFSPFWHQCLLLSLNCNKELCINCIVF